MEAATEGAERAFRTAGMSGSRTMRTGMAAALLLGGLFAVIWLASVRNGLLYLVGAGLGATLVISGIGFTAAWRNFIVKRKAQGFITTLVLLSFATLAFIPALATIDGTVPNLAPAGITVIIGAAIFGIGMQLGNGCGSGNLMGAGNGSPHSMLVLLAFLPGSLIGSIHLPWWLGLPLAGKQVNLAETLGASGAILAQLIAFGVLIAVAVKLARKSDAAQALLPSRRQLLGCVALIALAMAALLVSGRMWSITFGHALWGAKVADLLGAPVAATTFWNNPYASNALANSVFADITSVMNIGLLTGVATLALARDQGKKLSLGRRQAIAAILAGLLMGYGARLSFGCNIGALFSGSASGSLHAWIWFAAAWVGCHVGIRLRPRFGMAN